MVSIVEMSMLIPLLSGAIVSIIGSIQNSRCVNIKCCCFSCSRQVPDIIETEEDNKEDN